MNEIVTIPAEAKPASESFFEKLGFGAVLFVFGGLILWSVIAPIEGAVIAGGQIVVESNRKAVQHLEGGVVGEILVREGDIVQEGDVLIRLDNTIQNANNALIESQLTELYARRARLEAERDSAASLAGPRGAEAIIKSAAFSEKLAGQRQLFDARVQTQITQISLLEERITQQRERIAGLGAQIQSLRSQLALINDELTSVRELYDQGYAPLTRLRALEREAERLSGERGALTSGIAEAESAISEARLEMTRLKEAFTEEAIAELRDVEVSISELEERRITSMDALNRTEITASRSGRVLNLAVHTIGGVIAPGAPLMEIVPDGDRLQIAARVSPSDVEKLRTGQETLVRFTSFGARQTPETTGRVKTISADSIVEETTGAAYYMVFVELPDSETLTDALRGESLIPGMPVEAFIRTGSRPAISFLLKPLTDSMARSLRED